ncbi:ABC transporter permease [Ruicaihuangia caeni]|uniref:ABC transporter permease n=1 Tax=Ruicaihuangia caeni TaxID=3042517 RepID=A0AAW6TBE8_9MICO|nr:ABC transporter permease [Klugiella sp. YN-L-19]MDI2099278.1 ABC transporter permease [Klugiella sp. YN-L-19]
MDASNARTARPLHYSAARERAAAFFGRHAIRVIGALAVVYLLLPIAVVVLMSLNDPAGRYNFTFNAFTLDNWANMCGPYGLCESVLLSLQIALAAAAAATVIGVLAAYALTRFDFAGRATANVLVLLPMTMPEVVLGASLLTLYVNAGIPLGPVAILLAHIMFCISFVIIVVKARLAMLDSRLLEAATDLYANPWRAFRRVTLPLAAPGILAGAVLAFALSFDDFIITNFNSGSAMTFPMYVWGAAKRGVPPQVNVVATLIFLVVMSLAVTMSIVTTVRARRAR